MRAYAGFLLVFPLAACIVVSLLGDQMALYARSVKFQGDAISRYQDRFRGVRERLPSTGAIGYFTDITEHSENRADLFLTQYALAPLVLRESTDFPVVVGNYRRGLPSPGEIRHKGLRLFYNTGNGIVLFEKAAP